MRVAALMTVVFLALAVGRCQVDRTEEGWPGQREAFERLCERVGVCFYAAVLVGSLP